jgi:hypothetical protein
MTRTLPLVSRRLAVWGALFAAGIGVAIALNVVLLGLAGERHDPVGRLSPVGVVPASGTVATVEPTAEAPPPAEPTTTDDDHREHDRDDGGDDD